MAKYSNEYFAASRGEVRTSDERAARIDVPAVTWGNFEKPVSDLPHGRLQRWGRAEHERLLTACADQQGTPIRAYITFLIAHRATLKRAIQKHIATFLSEAVERQLGSRNMATARNFACYTPPAAWQSKPASCRGNGNICVRHCNASLSPPSLTYVATIQHRK
jgi:hypothetical protein